MKNELNNSPSSHLLDLERVKNHKSTENIPSLFEETNKILIDFLKEIKKYDPNNTSIEILLKSEQIFTIDNYLKNYSFFSNEFFISEMEKPLKPINFNSLKTEIEKDLEFCISLKNTSLIDSEIFKNKLAEEEKELKDLQQKIKEFPKENEKIEKQIEEKKLELAKATKEYEDCRQKILDKINFLFENKIKIIDIKLNEFSKSKILEKNKDELNLSFDLFREKFIEVKELYEKKSELRKIEGFDLDNLIGFLDKESVKAEKEFKHNYEELNEYLDHELKHNNDEKMSEILIKKIEEQKNKNLEQEKSLKELINEENLLASKLAGMKNQLYHKKAILSQQPYAEKFKENVINTKNLTLILLIIVMLILFVLL